MDQIVIHNLLEKISAQYQLNPGGVHGLSHWGRVLENGLRLAEEEGGDQTVITLFAIFHDACRQNQSVDPGHGSRGAELAYKLLKDHPDLRPDQLDMLITACQQHTDGKTDGDLTVQICFDADRLDLLRSGIRPRPRYLCTNTARKKSTIRWANRRATTDFTPDYVKHEWLPIFSTYKPKTTN